MRHFSLVALVSLLALALVACDDAEGEDNVPTPLLEIEVGADELDPRRVEVRAPDRYQLVVTNQGSEECLFNLGPYVRDLPVAPGETGEIDFQVPPDDPEGELEMGCSGTPDRTGTVIVRTGTALP